MSKSLEIQEKMFFLWKPRRLNSTPVGFNIFPMILWKLFHYLRIFRSNYFSVSCLYIQNVLVHHIYIFPAFFRFPFMHKNDIQFGDIWTSPSLQNMGIAKKNLKYLSSLHSDKKIWFLCDENNFASRKIAEDSGFVFYGYGYKTKKIFNFLSQYILINNQNNNNENNSIF